MPGKVERGNDRWLKIELSAPSDLVDALSNFVTEIGAQGVFQEERPPQPPNELSELSRRETLYTYLPCDVRLEGRIASLKNYMESLSLIFPHLEKTSLATETIAEQDWGEQWKKYFRPLRVGRDIVIKPTWERYVPSGRDVIIEIDPGMAFGTGQHPSTRMCLEAMEDIILRNGDVRNGRVLDAGAGTGILGIAAVKLGAREAVCVDIDGKATDIARENVTLNHVGNKVEIINGDIRDIHGPFVLIIANLTAKILTELHTHLIFLMEERGCLVLSGIIEQDRNDIEESFFAAPLVARKIITEKEWLCYVLQKMG